MPPTKNPAATFFWNDWEDDKELKLCSLAAQGLWMRLLCIAARSPEPGIVQMGEHPSTLETALPLLSRSVAETVETIRPLIDELLTSGAASLDRHQRIFCRRMVRAAALSAKRSDAGQRGAAATHGKDKANDDLPRQETGNELGKPPPSSFFRPSNLQGLNPSSRSRSGSARGIGKILNGGKGEKDPNKADQHMAAHLQKHCRFSAEDAWRAVVAARQPTDPDHARFVALCQDQSIKHKIGWYPRAAA